MKDSNETQTVPETQIRERTHTETTVTTAFAQLKEREEQVICSTYGRYPLAVKKAHGARLVDLEGKEYVDLLAGIAVAGLGHSRPELTKVMAEQADKLLHVSNLFYQEEHVVLAEKLLATCAQSHPQGKVFFSNSGAEANEAAIKLARRYMRTIKDRDAYEIITLAGSFHGRTLATITATGQDAVKEHFHPLPEGFTTVAWNDLDALSSAITDKTAAVLVEIVQGEGGVRPMDAAYAQGIQDLCRERGILFMVDEVQAGLCRTGRFWAFQHFGLEPDVFTTAKALANGLPMGAMVATNEAARGFAPGAHATTFGGGGVLSAVAAKVLDILVEEQLCVRAAELGEYALELFEGLKAKYPGKIAEVRGLGLMIGIELAEPGQDVWQALMDRRFVLNLAHGKVLRLLPPLVIDKADVEAFAEALGEVLAG